MAASDRTKQRSHYQAVPVLFVLEAIAADFGNVLFSSMERNYSEKATPLGVALSVEKKFNLILKVPFGTKYLRL
jgi:hypothetical protein